MPWVVDDVCGCGGQKVVGNTGELRNPDFPPEKAVGEEWTGTIDAYNAGAETDTFRIRINGEEVESFSLAPGATRTVSRSGTGPANFWIYLDRWTGAVEPPWLEFLRKHWLPLTILSTWSVGMVAVGVAVK